VPARISNSSRRILNSSVRTSLQTTHRRPRALFLMREIFHDKHVALSFLHSPSVPEVYMSGSIPWRSEPAWTVTLDPFTQNCLVYTLPIECTCKSAIYLLKLNRPLQYCLKKQGNTWRSTFLFLAQILSFNLKFINFIISSRTSLLSIVPPD